MQKSVNMTFGFAGVRLLGFRVPGLGLGSDREVLTSLWFYALNFRQTPAIRDISRTQVHTGTPHVFCHTTTVIACVFVKIWAVKKRQLSRSYRQTQHFSGFMLSTSARLRQSETYPGLKSTQAPHMYSVTQPRPSRVYL